VFKYLGLQVRDDLPPGTTRSEETVAGLLSGSPDCGNPSTIFSIAPRAVSSFART
jgi:hypothetical protein